jgi:lauroyl/myristoyl acyltransferase
MLSRTLNFNPNEFLKSRQGLKLAQRLSRIIPPVIGYRMAYLVADLISARKGWSQVKAVRCNQWVVRGERLSGADLDQVVRDTFRNIAHNIYDLYHYMDDPSSHDRMINFSAASLSVIARSQSSEGMVLVSMHLGNFDLAFKALTVKGLQGLVFNQQAIESGHQAQYQIRQHISEDVRPIDMNTLRHAVTRLREGGTVITMVDWPVPESKYRPYFFGRPSMVAVHYVYLAMKARVPVVLLVMLREKEHTYRFLVSEPIAMQEYPDKQEGLVRNAEKVLRIAEGFLLQAPQQWAMSRPVWPNFAGEVPE